MEPLLAYTEDRERGGTGAELREQEHLGGGSATRILCAACDAPITTRGDRIQVRDRHEHYFVNPSGFDFQIGCYAAAPGTLAVGCPSAEFTWFPGHTWQTVICGSCGWHLGWKFAGDTGGFHGLIVDRLVEEENGGGEA